MRADIHVGTLEEEHKTGGDDWNKGQRDVRREDAILVASGP